MKLKGRNQKPVIFSLLISVILFMLFLVPQNAFAEGIIDGQVVEATKSWTINFSSDIEFDDATKNAVYVTDSDVNKVDVSLSLGQDNKSIIVSAPSGGYSSGERYALNVDKGVHGKDGSSLNRAIFMNFSIKPDSEDTSSKVINSYEEYYNAVKNSLANFDDSITLKINNYDKTIYNLDVINKIMHDDPLIDYGYSETTGTFKTITGSSDATITLAFKYNKSSDEMKYMESQAASKADSIVSSIIKPDMKDWQKELAIHDYIVNNANYDASNYNSTRDVPEEDFTDYGILVKGKGVCEGYAKAMFRLLNKVGIECIYVTGKTDGVGHAWNIVKIGGGYYQVDATYDDPVSSNGESNITHSYFNVTDSIMAKDHTWDTADYPKCTDTAYAYNNLSITEYDSDGNVITKVKSYNEFYNAIQNAILSKSRTVSLKVINYNSSTYNVKSTVQKILMVHPFAAFGGCTWETRQAGNDAYIKIKLN